MTRYSSFFSKPVVTVLALFFLVIAAPVMVTGTTTPISWMSPYPDGGDPNDPLAVTQCNGGAQQGVVYRNSETEPYIAVNPTASENMIACWHQDRWSTGAAQGVGAAYSWDGGATWTHVNIPFTKCSGGAVRTAGDYERASDPWITFGPDGAAYYMALVTDNSTQRNGQAVSKSTDGGMTWSTPVMIKDSDARGVKSRALFHDKNSMTADPYDPNLVYATWTLFRNRTLALLFSRSTDGGETWEAARPVNKFEPVGKHEGVAFRQGSQIVVLPDGTLLNAFYRGVFGRHAREFTFRFEMGIFRSFDQGKHWERLDTPVSWMQPTGGFDFELNITVRDAGQLPDIAVDRNNGNIYIVWQDGRFNPFGASTVVISKSEDGGDTWTEPMPVHPPAVFNQFILPAVAVADDGTVGVLYYDHRFDFPGNATWDFDVHMMFLDPFLNRLEEVRLTDQSFDMRQMVITGDRGFFPGDYVGLDSAGDEFVAAITVSNNLGLPVEFPQDNSGLKVDSHNRQDIVFARAAPSLKGPTSFQWDKGEPRLQLTGDGESMPALGERAALHTNVPNPFNPQTTIGFTLAEGGPVYLDVFDVSGRRIKTLVGGEWHGVGDHSIPWDGRTDSGAFVASGVYLYRLRTDGFTDTKRMMLMK